MNLDRISFVLMIIFVTFQRVSSEETDTEIPTYTCQLYDDGSRCDLTGIHVTTKQPFFKISTSNPEKITEIFISQSNIPILSNSICTIFPSLIRINIVANVKQIHKDAFESCPNVLEISLANNLIEKLDKDTFKSNTELFSLSLEGNQLKELPDEIFATLEDLEFLHLENNCLTGFNTNLLAQNKILAVLFIFSNNLTDLDVEKLKRNISSLEAVYANNNDFSCKRVREMTLFAEVCNNFFKRSF